MKLKSNSTGKKQNKCRKTKNSFPKESVGNAETYIFYKPILIKIMTTQE